MFEQSYTQTEGNFKICIAPIIFCCFTVTYIVIFDYILVIISYNKHCKPDSLKKGEYLMTCFTHLYVCLSNFSLELL